MGWLKDLMLSAPSPVPSFGRLAQLSLEHPEWPVESRIKERSLSTLFSKVDRGLETEWLRERPAIQRILAQLMGRSPTEIRLGLGEPSHGGGERTLRLHDVRYARDVDLTREPLPPGIPREALDPPSWGPTVWIAPSGSGRSLAGAWLHARGLARHVLLRSDADLDRVPTRGPLFVEVRGSVGIDERLLERLRSTARPILLAGSFGQAASFTRTTSFAKTGSFGGPHGRSLDFSPGPRATARELPEVLRPFITIHSPRVEEYLPELVDWVHARLNPEGHFDPDAVEDWMRRVAIPSGAIRHLGDALGLLGMLDELSPKMRAGRRLPELAAAFVRNRIREATDRDTFGPKVAEETYAALENAATRCLVLQGQSIAEPRSEAEWTAVLAEQTSDESPDPAWFQTALRTTLGRSVSRKELKRATKLLPPRAFQLARALEHSALLRPVLRHPSTTGSDDDDAFELGPHFLVRLLEAHAENDALSFSATEWGSLLRRPKHRDRVFDALLARALREEWDAHYAAIDDDCEPNPSQTAAVEAAFATLAFATLAGRRAPLELERTLERDFCRSLVRLGDSFEPKVAPDDGFSYSRAAVLAAFACRADDVARVEGDAADPPLGSRAFLEQAIRALGDHAERGALPPSIGEALFERLGNVARRRPVPGMLFAFLTAIDAEGSAPEILDDFEGVLRRYAFPEFAGALRGKGVRASDVFSRVWRALGTSAVPTHLWPDASSEFWAAIPVEVLEARVRDGRFVDWARVAPHRLEGWVSRTTERLPKEVVSRLPIDVILAAKSSLFEFRPEALELLPPSAIVRLFTDALAVEAAWLEPYLPPPESAAFDLLTELRSIEEPDDSRRHGALRIALSLVRSDSRASEVAHEFLARSHGRARSNSG